MLVPATVPVTTAPTPLEILTVGAIVDVAPLLITVCHVEVVGKLVGSAAFTNAVVAISVLFVPTACVGAVGVPVNAGDASGAKAVLVKALLPSVPPEPIFSVEPLVPESVKDPPRVSVLLPLFTPVPP